LFFSLGGRGPFSRLKAYFFRFPLGPGGPRGVPHPFPNSAHFKKLANPAPFPWAGARPNQPGGEGKRRPLPSTGPGGLKKGGPGPPPYFPGFKWLFRSGRMGLFPWGRWVFGREKRGALSLAFNRAGPFSARLCLRARWNQGPLASFRPNGAPAPGAFWPRPGMGGSVPFPRISIGGKNFRWKFRTRNANRMEGRPKGLTGMGRGFSPRGETHSRPWPEFPGKKRVNRLENHFFLPMGGGEVTGGCRARAGPGTASGLRGPKRPNREKGSWKGSVIGRAAYGKKEIGPYVKGRVGKEFPSKTGKKSFFGRGTWGGFPNQQNGSRGKGGLEKKGGPICFSGFAKTGKGGWVPIAPGPFSRFFGPILMNSWVPVILPKNC